MANGESSGESIGSGVRVGASRPVTGVAYYVDGIAAVISLMEEDVSELVLIVHEAGATGVAPILSDARGVICTSGGPTSHLALVAKEFDVACIMAAKLSCDPATLGGAMLTLEGDGTISRASEAA